jgi:hypothetical protein
MNDNRDIKLFLYGGCDLHDIVENPIIEKHFEVIKSGSLIGTDTGDLNFNKGTFSTVGTSLISLYTKPGPIAQRVLETLVTARKRDVFINRDTYNEIVKFPMLSFYKKHAGPNDYLLLSFSPEIYTKFRKSTECFTCVPTMKNLENPDNCLHWLYTEYLRKEEFLLPFDTKESLELSFDLMVDFARDIYEIFQDRVILVKTHFSNFAIGNDFRIKKIQSSPKHLLYYKQTKIITDPLDQNYADRLSMIIMKKFRHHYRNDLSFIQLTDPVFLDLNHRYGVSQFHIDAKSRDSIARLIYQDLVKKSLNKSNEC